MYEIDVDIRTLTTYKWGMTHSQIIEWLGGIRKVATALGHNNHTTVQGWAERDKIPVERWAELIAASEALEKPIKADDLMPADLRGAA